MALASWILAVESLCEHEAAKTWVGGKDHKSGILNCVFNFLIIWLITQNKSRQQQTWLKILILFRKFWPWNCVRSSGVNSNHLLSLKKTIGKSLYVLFPFCMFKGLLLHIWHLHIYGEEMIAFISLTLSYELMYLVALLTIAAIEKNFYHLRGVSTMPTNSVGIILLNGFCLVSYFFYI